VDIVKLDEQGLLYLSPDIDEWAPVEELRISAVIDMDGDLDIGVPTVPNHMLYIYFPIFDEELPDLQKLHAVARMGAALIKSGHRVLSHCGMGLNRSALMAGLIMTYLGVKGPAAVELIRQRRPGALFNENFALYLASIGDEPEAGF
jgi:protein-tyrosine phosphatase